MTPAARPLPVVLALSLGACASITPAPYAEKEQDALYAPGERVDPGDTGGEDGGVQPADTMVGALRYGQRTDDIACAFLWDVAGPRAAEDVPCPSCDLVWAYEASYTMIPEDFSDDCLALPFIAAYASRPDYLSTMFTDYGQAWVLGERSGGAYMLIGRPPETGYYDYYGYSYYSYFRALIGTYEVSFDEARGEVEWGVEFGGYSYYGYYDYDASSRMVYYLSGTATVR
jgi:hypothetical protein